MKITSTRGSDVEKIRSDAFRPSFVPLLLQETPNVGLISDLICLPRRSSRRIRHFVSSIEVVVSPEVSI